MKRFRSFLCGMHEVLDKIKARFPAQILESKEEHMLKDHLFHGMASKLCVAVRHVYERPETNFGHLLMTAHHIEAEEGLESSKTVTVQSKVAAVDQSKDSLAKIGEQLDTLLTTMKDAQFPEQTQHQNQHRGKGNSQSNGQNQGGHPNQARQGGSKNNQGSGNNNVPGGQQGPNLIGPQLMCMAPSTMGTAPSNVISVTAGDIPNGYAPVS